MKRLICLVAFFLSACMARSASVPAPEVTPALRPYLTATASPTATPPLQPVETPLPTATPFTYVVQSGDTLSGIAERFGVRLEVLQAANPAVSPNSMSVGTVLTIPADADNPAVEPTPTPVPVPVRQVVCYPSPEGGMWCFVLVHNDTADVLENISAQVTLYMPSGELLAGQTAFLLLDTLPAGASSPLVVFFPPDVPRQAQARVQLLTATRLQAGDGRYLPVVLENTLTSVDWSGRRAQVSGKIYLLEGAPSSASLIWVAAAAYAADGRLVGVRRWESTAGLSPGGRLDFAFVVFSLGPPIERVDLLVEARPK